MSADPLPTDDPGAVMLLATHAEELIAHAATRFCEVVRGEPGRFEEALATALVALRMKVGGGILADAAAEAFEKAARREWAGVTATASAFCRDDRRHMSDRTA